MAGSVGRGVFVSIMFVELIMPMHRLTRKTDEFQQKATVIVTVDPEKEIGTKAQIERQGCGNHQKSILVSNINIAFDSTDGFHSKVYFVSAVIDQVSGSQLAPDTMADGKKASESTLVKHLKDTDTKSVDGQLRTAFHQTQLDVTRHNVVNPFESKMNFFKIRDEPTIASGKAKVDGKTVLAVVDGDTGGHNVVRAIISTTCESGFGGSVKTVVDKLGEVRKVFEASVVVICAQQTAKGGHATDGHVVSKPLSQQQKRVDNKVVPTPTGLRSLMELSSHAVKGPDAQLPLPFKIGIPDSVCADPLGRLIFKKVKNVDVVKKPTVPPTKKKHQDVRGVEVKGTLACEDVVSVFESVGAQVVTKVVSSLYTVGDGAVHLGHNEKAPRLASDSSPYGKTIVQEPADKTAKDQKVHRVSQQLF